VVETFYGHGTVVNSAAMKLLGIAERPANPLGASYERDPATGRFNGRANEYANWVINRRLADFVSDADALTDLKRMGAEAAAFGVTTLQVMPMMRIERFVRLLEQADLPVRVRAIPFSLTTVRARDMTEIRSLAVDDTHRGQGIGRRLTEWAVDEARRLQIRRIMSLTYEQAFFEKLGFEVVNKDTLPLKVWSDCVRCPKRDGCDEIAMVRTLSDVPMIVMPTTPPTPKGVSIPVLEYAEE